MAHADELGGKLLEGVSRSFYLTLKALPQALREPLSLAYLLARVADTLADTPEVSEGSKQESLGAFDRLVQRPDRNPEGEQALIERLGSDFIPRQVDADEARLLERLGEAFDAFWSLPIRFRKGMRTVLFHIVKGQSLDVQRFPVDGQLRALSTAAELDGYTWYVAGSVGDYWTRLCADELEGVFSKDVSIEQMLEWGGRYGKGLQLVNILRDIGKDIRMGRCYFPMEELAAYGVSLDEVQRNPACLVPVTAPWRALCREHLEHGVKYLDAVRHKRLRYATALPLLLGIKTLRLINSATPEDLVKGVKVTRAVVFKTLFQAGVANLSQSGMRGLGERLMGRMGQAR